MKNSATQRGPRSFWALSMLVLPIANTGEHVKAIPTLHFIASAGTHVKSVNSSGYFIVKESKHGH